MSENGNLNRLWLIVRPEGHKYKHHAVEGFSYAVLDNGYLEVRKADGMVSAYVERDGWLGIGEITGDNLKSVHINPDFEQQLAASAGGEGAEQDVPVDSGVSPVGGSDDGEVQASPERGGEG